MNLEREVYKEALGEFVGTFILISIGVSTVSAAVLANTFTYVWQVGLVWGFGLTTAIYVTNSLSGAHLNPAISIAFSIFRKNQFPSKKLFHYILSQLFGALFASILAYNIWKSTIIEFEKQKGITRGAEGSEASAMVLCDYFPNPATGMPTGSISPLTACLIEAFGTFILSLVIFSITDHRNALLRRAEPIKSLTPILIGFTLAVLISLFAPLTQAARDIGPRFVAYFAGWGKQAFPGPLSGFWVYTVGPILGAIGGGMLNEYLIGVSLRFTEVPASPPVERANQSGDTESSSAN